MLCHPLMCHLGVCRDDSLGPATEICCFTNGKRSFNAGGTGDESRDELYRCSMCTSIALADCLPSETSSPCHMYNELLSSHITPLPPDLIPSQLHPLSCLPQPCFAPRVLCAAFVTPTRPSTTPTHPPRRRTFCFPHPAQWHGVGVNEQLYNRQTSWKGYVSFVDDDSHSKVFVSVYTPQSS